MLRYRLLVDFRRHWKLIKNDRLLLKSSNYIAKSVERLGLVMAYNNKVTKQDISSIVTRCPNLQMFDLNKSNVDFETMKIIALSCTKLTHLGLGMCKYINNEMIKVLF